MLKEMVPTRREPSDKALVRLGLHLAHLLLMQLHHATLPHAAVHDMLRTRLIDPLLLPADALATLLVHQRRAAGLDLLIAVVGCRVRCLEAGVPCGNSSIVGRGRGTPGEGGLRCRRAVVAGVDGWGGGVVGIEWLGGG